MKHVTPHLPVTQLTRTIDFYARHSGFAAHVPEGE